MPTAEPTVFVVDDDAAVRDSLQVLLKSVGISSEGYSTADEFLAGYDPKTPGCLVLDVRMPGMSGLELQRRLNEEKIVLPIIMVSGHGDIRMAVDAMHKGAIDFLEKPLREHVLLQRIGKAVARDAESRRQHAERAAVETRLARLTAREREILESVLAGKTTKVIAWELGLNHKTVESHRANIMRKMDAQNVIDLVRIVSTVRAHSY